MWLTQKPVLQSLSTTQPGIVKFLWTNSLLVAVNPFRLAEVGKVTFKSNSDEALNDEFLLISNGGEAINDVYP